MTTKDDATWWERIKKVWRRVWLCALRDEHDLQGLRTKDGDYLFCDRCKVGVFRTEQPPRRVVGPSTQDPAELRIVGGDQMPKDVLERDEWILRAFHDAYCTQGAFGVDATLEKLLILAGDSEERAEQLRWYAKKTVEYWSRN